MKKLIVFTFLFCGFLSFSQKSQLDSLEEGLRKLKGKDKAEQYVKIAAKFRESPDTFLIYINKAKEVLKEFPDENVSGKIFLRMGDYYSDKGNIDEGIKNYLSALTCFEKTGDQKNLARVCNNMGVVYIENRNYDYAKKYLEKSMEIKKLLGDSQQIATAINNLGSVYYDQNDYPKALDLFKSAFSYGQFLRDKTLENICQNIGNCYSEMGKTAEATKYFEKAISLSKELEDEDNLVYCLINASNLYRNIEKHDKAIPMAKEALEISTRNDLKAYKQLACESLAESYASLNDYKTAYGYLTEEMQLKDTIYDIKTSESIAEMQTKFDVERKEKENALLAEQNKSKDLEISRGRYLTYGLSGLVILVLLIAYLFLRQNKLQALQRSMSLEQKLLRSQMNPHFIFNSLTAIESFIYTNEPKEAGRYLSGFAKLMRLILENSREEYISLEKEIKTLQYYLDLQKLRFDDKFEYKIILEDGLEADSIAIPPMLAQPFIENSIEHGIKNMETKGAIEIHFRKENNEVHFEVKDNGIGMEKSFAIKEDKKSHQSLATKITQERLSILNRSKQGKIKLLIEELKDKLNNVVGTQVSFNIPFREI